MTGDQLARDPGSWIHGPDVVIPARQAGPLLRWFIPVLRDRVAASGWTLVIPDEIAGFLEALNACDVARERGSMSDIGPATTAPVTVEDVRSPEDAGAVVGMSARHVRRLCRAGLVGFRPSGARGYLVDVDSLRTYLRTRGAVA